MQIIFEPHATTFDNEAKVCSGWNDVALSPTGEKQAAEMGTRYSLEDFDAIFTSDLQRAYRTAKLAFLELDTLKLRLDWRLRECDYGDMTLAPRAEVDADKITRIRKPFPNGESYEQAMQRMKSFIDDLRQADFKRVLIIGSRATHYGLDHWIDNVTLEHLLTHEFVWQPGWKYELQ